jgi:chromosome segregation ATPase
MSSEPKESSHGTEQNRSTRSDGDPSGTDGAESQRLTIALPDGSESVSDAIVTHREMLIEPKEHGLATDEEIVHLSEAMETLSEDVEEVTQQYADSQSQTDELRERVKRQQRQIDELRSAVTSLAQILGTEAEWETFDDT